MNKDKATTIFGVLAGVAQIVGLAGLGVPVEVTQTVTGLALALLGYFTNKK